MARRTDRNLKAVYRVAERWVDVALRDNNSLFTPDKPIWSAETLNDFYGRFVANPEDDSADSFVCLTVVHGSAEIRGRATSFTGQCGDTFLIPAGRPFAVQQTGGEPVEYLMASVP